MDLINITGNPKLYPLQFEPAYKQVFWGGSKLRTVLHRDLPEDTPAIGESWEICDRPNISSEVINGPLAGMTLRDLVARYGASLIGKNYNGGPFPLMVKLLDAAQPISMQVHPTEEFCAKHPSGCEPKAEMWYVLDTDPGSVIYSGLRGSATRQIFLSSIREPGLENLLQQFAAVKGDAYFIPAGRVHTMSGGNLILEVSQNSDTNFRLMDWNRVDEAGEKRELHTHDAVVCMDFIDRTVSRISGVSNTTAHNRKYPLVNRCPHFHCDELILVTTWRDSTGNGQSCHILTAVNHPLDVITGDGMQVRVQFGESVLIPACCGEYRINVEDGVRTNLIRTTL